MFVKSSSRIESMLGFVITLLMTEGPLCVTLAELNYGIYVIITKYKGKKFYFLFFYQDSSKSYHSITEFTVHKNENIQPQMN